MSKSNHGEKIITKLIMMQGAKKIVIMIFSILIFTVLGML